MSIDFDSENIITLAEACRRVPPDGVSTATMARWIQRGVRGVKLETIVIGGRRLTSVESLSRFFTAQNATDAPSAPVITATQRRRQSEAARTELEKMGVSGGVRRTAALTAKDFVATNGVMKH